MKEQHFGYKITSIDAGVNFASAPLSEERMLDLLTKISLDNGEGLYWIFKKFGDAPQEPLCIVDCETHRIYYHFSGIVDNLHDAIGKLKH